ncbi:MAG: LacI family DNA-binding transcriptional regulator [Micropruina sp.]
MPTTPTADAPSGQPKAATIYDVARLAGVSHQTVSRLLKGENTLSPRTRRRVEKALAELDYRPNEAARTLATRRSQRIGAFISDLHDWAPQRILAGVADAARDAGYVLEIIPVDPRASESIRQAIAVMNKTALAGVVVLSPTDPVIESLDLARLRMPVEVESEPDLTSLPDTAQAHPFTKLVDHLADLGHRRFFHIAGPPTWRAARNRTLAYRNRLHELGLTEAGSAVGDWTSASGYAAMASFPRSDPPTAIISANDLMALGAEHWLHEHGYAVPRDVSIVGFDGLPETRFFHPPLTTIQIDFEELGRRTVARLLAQLSEEASADPWRVPHTLVIRESSGPAR